MSLFSKLFKKHAVEQVVAVVDIGSGSAGVAIISLKPGAPAMVLASSHASLSSTTKRTHEAAAQALSGRLIAAAQECIQAYHRTTGVGALRVVPVSQVYAVVHTPWTRATVQKAERSFDVETLVTQQLLAAIGQEALGDSADAPARFFEASVVRVELNGYPTSMPLGKRAKHVRVAVLTSTCNPTLYKAADEALAGSFPDTPRLWRSSARAVVTALGAMSDYPRDAVIAEVGAEASDLIVVRKGTIAGQATVPEGTNAMLRRLGDDASAPIMLDTLRLMNEDRCDSAQCDVMLSEMARVEPDLVQIFGEAFASLTGSGRLPERLYVVTHPELGQWLGRFFARIDFTQFSITTQPFSTTVLQAQSLGRFAMPEGKTIPLDASLAVAIASVYIEHGA